MANPQRSFHNQGFLSVTLASILDVRQYHWLIIAAIVST
jgi:hypothetical protein